MALGAKGTSGWSIGLLFAAEVLHMLHIARSYPVQGPPEQRSQTLNTAFHA